MEKKKEFWIVSIGNDDFKCHPQKIKKNQVKQATKEGYIIFHNKQLCQAACDFENSL